MVKSARTPRQQWIRTVLWIVALTVFLHAWAVALLPQDYDEPVYLQNAFDYSEAIRSGSLQAVIDYDGTSEHPSFVKLLYATAILILGNAGTWAAAFYASRVISALFGILAVVWVTIAVDPLSGAFMALNTLNVKYTSQVYLEAVPHAMTIAAVLAMVKVEQKKNGKWFWLSALALGIAAASKFTYIPVVVVVLAYLTLFEKKTSIGWLLLYAALALGTFFLLDVHLWSQPLARLAGAFSFHTAYSQSAHVAEVGYPWYQPLIWIFTSSPAAWHPQVFFYFGFDTFFAIFALAGIPREWKERRWLVIWLGAGLIFLLLWPTRWPQYVLTITPALCIMAAATARRLFTWLKSLNNYWDYLRNMLPNPGKGLWITIGLFVLFLMTIYLSAAARKAIGMVGWSSMTAENSSLPNNTVNVLLPLANDRMFIGTSSGASIWIPPATEDEEGAWLDLATKHASLADVAVFSATTDASGSLWIGTNTGVTRYNGSTYTEYPLEVLGVQAGPILALCASSDGWIYAGSLEGAVGFNGQTWVALPEIATQAVFSIAASDQALWISTNLGVWQFPADHGDPVLLPIAAPAKHLLVDSTGRLWAATTGAGLAQLEDTTWRYTDTGNSGLSLNTLNWITEIEPGVYWVAAAYANRVGGFPLSWQDGNWHAYIKNNSGASGSEPLVIAADGTGRIWIGTRSRGIDIYQRGR